MKKGKFKIWLWFIRRFGIGKGSTNMENCTGETHMWSCSSWL